MIEIAGQVYELGDPLVLLALGGVALAIVIVVLLVLGLRAAKRSAKSVGPVFAQLELLGGAIQGLGAGQEQLTGSLRSVSDAQATAQTQIVQVMESRLATVQQSMNDRLHENALKSARSLSDMQERIDKVLHGSSEKTTKSLTELQERLATIDRAQVNIEKLSGDVISLQDILSNKQARGSFGEFQLESIVTKALPANAYSFQPTLSNGSRPDCLIDLPNPPGPIVIDAKFPLESYETLVAAQTPEDVKRALSALKIAVRTHIKAISSRYLIEGETADSALMFLPSEAVYAELHARLPEVVREGFAVRVWIVSPTTCMATLTTMRSVLKDARMREQAGAIRKELALLDADMDRLGNRVENLDRHFNQASKDITEIKISATKAGNRARRLDNFDFEEIEQKDNQTLPLSQPEP